MQIRSAEFVTSVAKPDKFLKRPIPHFVFSGRSNVGKSSLLNKLLNRKNLAKTSSTPGKTRLVNYFLINDNLFFVDIPGYGYAKVGKKEREAWGRLIEAYFQNNVSFIGIVFQLIDIRHDPPESDKQMIDFLQHYNIPFRIILTKADKLSRNQVNQRLGKIAIELGISRHELIATSAVDGRGIPEIWSLVNVAFEDTRAGISDEKEER